MSFTSENRSAIRKPSYGLFIWNGVFSAIVGSLFGPFMIKFLERIGGTDFHISLMNSLPGIVGVMASLPGALWLTRHRGKDLKTLAAEFTLISRLMVLFLIPLVWVTPRWAPLYCVVLLALKFIPESISQTALQGLTGDLFSQEERSTAITQRSRYSVPATLAISLLSGLILREVPGNDAQRLTIYQIFFILAAVFGCMEVFFLYRIPSASNGEKATPPALRDILRQMASNRGYKLYVAASLVYYFSWQMGWPLFSIYQVLHLRADELWLSIINVINAVGMFAGYRFWNRVIQRHGNGRTAMFATLGMSLNPILMVIVPNLYWVSGVNILIGFFTAGTSTVLLNALLEVTPQENRVVYVGAYNTLVNLSLAISPFFAYAVLKASGIVVAMCVVGGLRMVGSFAFWLYTRSRGRDMQSIMIE